MKATVNPAAVNRLASEGPACPAPMIIVSNCRAIAGLPLFNEGSTHLGTIVDVRQSTIALSDIDGHIDEDATAEPCNPPQLLHAFDLKTFYCEMNNALDQSSRHCLCEIDDAA